MVREHSVSTRLTGPVRMCVGCRKRVAVQELLRVVAREQESGWAVVPDRRRRATGRGANLHPTLGCLELALRRQALPRALRVRDRLAVEPLRDYVQHRLNEHDRDDRQRWSSSS